MQLIPRVLRRIARLVPHLLLAAACTGGLPALAQTPPLEPTAAERAWLETHPVVRVGVARQDWAPIEQFDASGRYVGMSAELVEQIARRSGITYEIHVERDAEALFAKVRAGEIDIVPSIGRTAGRERYMLFSQPYLDTPVVMITRRETTRLTPEATLEGSAVAVEGGFAADELVPQRYPKAKVQKFADTASALRAVSDGRADAYFGALAPASFVVERDLLSNLAVRGPVKLDTGLRLGIGRHAAALAPLLDRAIASIDSGTREQIVRRWMPVSLQLAAAPSPLQLDEAQRAWLAAHPRLRVGYIADYAPLTELGPDGRMHGMFADQIELLARRLGVGLETPRAFSLADLQRALAAREIDIALGLSRSPEREEFARFAGPMLTNATVAVARNDGALFRDPGQYNGKVLAMKRGHFLLPRLQRQYPGIQIVEYETLDLALDAVARGTADASLNDLTAVTAPLGERYAGVLRIVGSWVDAPSELHLAVRSDWPELVGLLKLALDSMTPAEKHELSQRWLVPKYRFVLPWTKLLSVGLPIVAVLGFIIWLVVMWNRRLAREVERRKVVEKALADARDAALDSADRKAAFLAALSHEVRTPMNGVIGMVDALIHSRLDENQRYQMGVVGRSASMALTILNDALDYARIEAGRFVLDPQVSDIRAMAEDVAALFAPMAVERGLRLQLFTAPQLPPLVLDGVRVRQLMANLLSNAIRYTEHGGVKLRIDGAPLTTRRWRLIIEIEDSGAGIAESDRHRLFHPFEPLGGPGAPGTGLGLAICRALSDAMGGRLEHSPGTLGGSRFTFTVEADAHLLASNDERSLVGICVRLAVSNKAWRSECEAWLRNWGAQVVSAEAREFSQITVSDGAAPLPAQAWVRLLRGGATGAVAAAREKCLTLSAEPLLPSRFLQTLNKALAPAAPPPAPLAEAPSKAPSEAAAPGTRKVLVVDDEPLNLRVAKDLLALMGFEVVLAGESQAGFEAFCSGSFAAILLDYRMPGEDGISLAARMRQRERSRGLVRTPIAAVTADGSETTASACLAAGMDTVLLKPLTLETLHATLSRLGCQPAMPPQGLMPEPEYDEEVEPLAHLAGLVGSMDRAHDIADGFVHASGEDLVELRDKLDVNDLEAVRFLAHRVKGGARNAGFTGVGAAAADLERSAKAGDVAATRRFTVSLTAALDRLAAELDRIKPLL
ncbi:transporter substrate-binding domain-containing protein [Niveibacterium sp. 24ML]|uniref:transporter substrate-binding domain-containing protein n=1 Tax=Niveibacterium sp. 24ML TaxID=2985512 RepID=UPI00226EF015|nr:transporter substrate-binding domain-containing protein [Niveibacterium sp. 24ML]MCX9157451.1 transporter substrate-binding domain-containing protein [Niveibacterium sp. 24ML]